MSCDALDLFPCDHLKGKYILQNCIICNGEGFYRDLVISTNGSPIEITGTNKVVQGLVTLLKTDQGTFSDYGYPAYGTLLNAYVGSKNVTENQVQYQAVQDVEYYVSLQTAENNLYGNVDSSEIIQDIEAIQVVNTVDQQAVTLALTIGEVSRIQFFTVNQYVNLL